MAAVIQCTHGQRADLEVVRRHQAYYASKGYAAGTCFPPYSLSNLGSEIRRVKTRIAALEGDEA